MRYGIVPLFFLVLLNTMGSAWAEKRIALVIGNGSYQHVPRLLNPRNDAEDVATSLRRSGFEVTLSFDLDKSGMDQATIDFSRAARTADIAFFYYTGHAMQFAGVNYLAPVDLDLTDEADLRRMTRVDEIVADLQQAKTLRILVLDSCRDNPFVDQLKRSLGATRAMSLQRGLAKIDSPEGMIISYATQSGRTATDGTGRNSPYTSAFLKHIEEQEEIGTIFRRIGSDVYTITSGGQLPELSLSFVGEFYLRGRLDIAVKPGVPASDPCAAATEHWKSAEAIGTVAAFEDHAARFPQCAFADLAKSRIAALTLPSSPLSAADVRRFNGTWISTVHCDAVQPNIVEWSLKVVAIVKDGVLHGGRGVDGQPGWAAYDGQIAADGMIALSIKDITGDQKLSRQGVLPSGTRREWRALGKLEGSHGSAVALISRTCNFNFSRISSSEAEPQSSVAPGIPQAGGLFTDQDMQRVNAIAIQDELEVMPRFKIDRPDGKLPAGLRTFVGIWASELGFTSGRGRHAMLIVTNVEAPAQATGYWVWGSPTAQDKDQTAAGAEAFNGTVTGDQLTFQTQGGGNFTGTFSRTNGSLSVVFKPQQFPTGFITMTPLWRLIEAERSKQTEPTLPALSAADVRGFDGSWMSTFACGAKPPDVLSFSFKFITKVKDGVLHGERGIEGTPGSSIYDGKFEPDGTIEISAKDITGDPQFSGFPKGTRREWRAIGKFEGSHGSAVNASARNCTFSFTKPFSGEVDTKSLTKKR